MRVYCRYVVLGDFQTAVAFLLASSPERSARWVSHLIVSWYMSTLAWLGKVAHRTGLGPGPPCTAFAFRVVPELYCLCMCTAQVLPGRPADHCAGGCSQLPRGPRAQGGWGAAAGGVAAVCAWVQG